MKFIRTFRQHGIAGNIAEGIEIKTETIFLLGKERKNQRKLMFSRLYHFLNYHSLLCMKVPLYIMLNSFALEFEKFKAKESLT